MFVEKSLKLSVLCCATILCSSALASQPYPTKPITLIVPFSPGGNLDITARAIAPALQKILGQPVVIDNKPGAGGSIGSGVVSRAAPDGYTVLVTTPNAIAVTPYMTKTPYALKNFRSVGMVASTPLIIDVNPKSKFKNIHDLMKFACANPEQVTVGHSGIGTTNYIGLIRLEEASNCQFTAVPYKGSAPALVDLLGGQIDMVIDQLSSSAGQLNSGGLKALAVMTAQKVPSLPNVPTLEESGVKGLNASTTTGLLVPNNTPDDVVNTLNQALQQIAKDQSVQTTLNNVGSTAISSTPQEFMSLIDNESSLAGKLDAAGKLQEN